MTRINVDISDNPYDVWIQNDLQDQTVEFLSGNTQNHKILIVTDAFFQDDYANELKTKLDDAGFITELYAMQGGKISKSFNEVLKLYGLLESNDYARDSTIIALGGGVVGDLAGFVASTWYRGMNLIQMPTTLMGMVDSSVGGKVAINFRDTINAIGNYYHPIANFMDINFIKTLPDRDYISGLAEVVKCGLIADKELLTFLDKNAESLIKKDTDTLVHCIKRALEIKVAHVKGDVKEGGKRLLLNYGHTIGHAIEMATQTDKHEVLRHGEGVSIGIAAVLELGEHYLGFPREQSEYARNILEKLKLPVSLVSSELGYEKPGLINKIFKLMHKDKKRKANKIRFVLLNELGSANTYSGIEDNIIMKACERVVL